MAVTVESHRREFPCHSFRHLAIQVGPNPVRNLTRGIVPFDRPGKRADANSSFTEIYAVHAHDIARRTSEDGARACYGKTQGLESTGAHISDCPSDSKRHSDGEVSK